MVRSFSSDRRSFDYRLLDRLAIHALLGVTVALYLWAAVLVT